MEHRCRNSGINGTLLSFTRSGGQDLALGGERDRAGGEVAGAAGVAPFPQGHVDGPVGTARLTELPGAVQRVEDPDPARAQARGVVGAFFGEHHVTGAPVRQLPGEELVRLPVARPAQHVRIPAVSPQLDQAPARPLGQVTGERVIVAGAVAGAVAGHRGSSSGQSAW